MACGWLYNPGNPHAADARETGFGQIPKYYRLTCEPFTAPVFPDDALTVSFGPQDAILKKITDETDARITGFAGYPEWWMVPPDRHKLIDFAFSESIDPIADWEARNPAEDWRDYYPRAEWWTMPGNPQSDNNAGFLWTVVAHLWADPATPIPSVVGGGGPVSFDFTWVTALWAPFGRNELLFSFDPAEGPRVHVEAYWP